MNQSGMGAQAVSRLCDEGATVVNIPLLVVGGDTVRFANHALLRTLGFSSASEFVGANVHDLLTDDTPAYSGHPFELDGEPLELLFFDPSGVPGLDSGTIPRPDLGPMPGELGRAILEVVPLPLIIQSIDTVLFANAATRKLWSGVDWDSMEGEPLRTIVHPHALEAMLERASVVFEAGAQMRNVPLKVQSLDGRVYHAVVDAYPLQAGDLPARLIVACSMIEAESD